MTFLPCIAKIIFKFLLISVFGANEKLEKGKGKLDIVLVLCVVAGIPR